MKKEYDFTHAKRAEFRALPPPAARARHTKIRITILLDQDVLAFFKAKAAEPGAEPYQTQINRALRELISSGRSRVGNELLRDEGFISRLSERVARYSTTKRARTSRSTKARRL